MGGKGRGVPLTLPDTGFFDLPIPGGGPTRPAACKIFIFDNNDYIFGTNNIKIKLYPTKEKKLTLVQNDDDVSTLKKWASLIG